MIPKVYNSTITKIELLTPTVYDITVEFEEDISFFAGQFMIIETDKITSGPRALPLKRSYSIASAPMESAKTKTLSFCIKKYEKGQFSSLLDGFKVGESLKIKGPFGHFCVKDIHQEKQLVLLAGGTGIAPMRSIIREVLDQRSEQHPLLLYTVKEPSEYIYREELEHYEEEKKIHLITTMTGDNVSWARTGRIDKVLLEETLDLSTPDSVGKYDFFICGPPAFVESMRGHLKSLGADLSQIHFEAWG